MKRRCKYLKKVFYNRKLFLCQKKHSENANGLDLL